MTDIGDVTAQVGFVVNTASLQTALIRAEAMATQRPVIVHVGLDPTQVTGAMAKVQAELMRGATIRIGLDSSTVQAALRGVTSSVDQNVTATQARINTMFGNMGSYAQGAARASADAFKQADREGQQNATNYRQTLRLNIGLENEAAQNYRKNMQLNLQLAAQRAAAEKAAATAVISAAQQSAQAFNDAAQRSKQSLDSIKLAYAQARATFDKNDGAASNWQQSRDAALAYQRSVQGVSTALNGLKTSGEATVGQLKQIADLEARLAREQNTLSGGINRLGISGNFSNAISGAQQLSMFMPGLIGQSLGAASAFQQIATSSGVMGVALGAAGVAVFALGKAFVDTSQAFGTFQQGLQGISSIDTSLSGVDMQGISDGLQQLSIDLPITTEQLTAMARGAVQMGITGKDAIMEFTSSIALLAVATRENNKSLGDTGQLANELGVFLNETGSTARTYTEDLKGVVATLAAVDKVTPGTIQSTLSLARYMASGSVVLNLNKESIIGLSGALSGLGARAEAGGSAVIRVLMAMNRAAGGTKDQMAGLEGVAGITKEELANVFQGSVTVKAKAFADVMGVTSSEFKTLVRTNPAQAFQLLADGLARAHASGIDMTAAMDEMGIKNVRDIRLIDQLTVGHGNLKVALDASTNSAKNQADLQDRVSKATQNSVDKTTELKNEWAAAVQSFGETNAPAYNFLLDFMKNAAGGAKEWADNLRGVTHELNSWSKISGIDLNLLSPEVTARVQRLVGDMKAMSDSSGGNMTPTMLAKYMADAKELEQIRLKTVTAQGSGTVNAAGPLLPGQKRGTYDGAPAAATGTIVQGSDIRRLLGLDGDRTGTPYGERYFGNQIHNGEDVFAPTGTPLNAPFAAYATTKWSKTTGHIIELIDATGQKLLLGHLNGYADGLEASIKAAGGKLLVKQGQLIGYVGQTGTLAHANLGRLLDPNDPSKGTTNSHVHYMAYDANGKIIDPKTTPFRGIGETPITANPNITPGGTTTGGGASEAEMRAMGQKLFDAYAAGDHSVATIRAINAFKKAHKELWQSIRDDAKKGVDDMRPITAEQIASAQRLTQAVQKAQEAHDPKALDAANVALKRFSDASFSNARAVQSVQGTQDKTPAGQYIASLADLKKYGDDALKLIKQQEAAQKSGDDDRIASADAAMAAFTKDSKARASVVQVEQAAYTSRNQLRSQAEQDAKKAQTEHDQRVKTATASQLAAEQALADGRSALAKTSAQRVIAAYGIEVEVAGSSASAKLLVEQAWQARRLKALDTISRAEAQAEVTNLEQQRNKLMGAEGTTKAQRQELWAQYAERISAVDAGLVVTLRGNQQTVTGDLKKAQADQLRVVQENAAKVSASLADVLANPDAYRDGAPKSVDDLRISLDTLNSIFPDTLKGADGFGQALDEWAASGQITNEMLVTMKARLDALRESLSFDSGLIQELAAGGAYANVSDGGRNPSGTDFQTLDPTDQNKSSFDAASFSTYTDALSSADFDSFIKGANLSEEAVTALTASWKTFNDGINKTLDDVNAHPELYGDGARNLPKVSDYDPAKIAKDLSDSQKLTGLRDGSDASALEYQHSAGLTTEADYLKRREELQKIAALHAFTNALAGGETYKIAQAQLQADLTKIEQDGILARKSLDETNRASDVAAANTHATNMLALKRSNAQSALEFERSQGTVSERAFIGQRQVQEEQAALDKYLDAFNTAGSDMVLAWDTYQAEMTAASQKGVTDRAALDRAGVDELVQGLQQIGGTFEQLDGMAGLFGKTLSTIGGGIQMLQKVPDLMTKTSAAMKGGDFFDIAGAVGGWLGMASEAINLIGGIGDAILNLSPGFQAWKKNLTEVANLEKAAAGASVGLFKNPFADALNEDAANRDKLVGANFWQRAAWAIFGGAPTVLSDEAAKLKVTAADIFADLGQGISTSLTDGLMNAFSTADWSGSEEMFQKSLNKTLAGMYIAATVKASGLEAAIQAYATAKANGGDGVAELANVRDLAMGVFSSAQTGISALTGYGADATSGITSKGLGTYLSDSQSSVQFGLPSMELKVPDSMLKSFDTLESGAAQLYTGATELRSAVAEWRAYMGGNGSSGPPARSGGSALAGM